jgi:hypothetical protein
MSDAVNADNHELERLMLQAFRDPAYRAVLIHALKNSTVFVEGRIEGGNTRLYDWRRSDGSRIIDVYTSEELLRQADGVNQQYCMRLRGLQLASVQGCAIGLSSADCTIEFDGAEFDLWNAPVTVSDRAYPQNHRPMRLQLLTAYPDQWVRPLAKWLYHADGAQAAYLGLLEPVSGVAADRLHVLLAVRVAAREDGLKMESELFNQATMMAEKNGCHMTVRLIDGSEASDDLALCLTEHAQPFYIRSAVNQWRRRLGLSPALAVKTL